MLSGKNVFRALSGIVAGCFLSASVAAVEIGKPAPGLVLTTLSNHNDAGFTLADYRGKVVYLDFWASWCGPCRASFPVLNELRTKYQAEGFEVVGVNLDENTADANGFLKKFPVSFPLATDPKGAAAQIFQIKGMPSAVIIDKKGVARAEIVGFHKDEPQKIEQLVSQLLKEPS